MIDRLRTPFFVVALLLLIILLAIEVGASWLNSFSDASNDALSAAAASNEEIAEALADNPSLDISGDAPPGLAIAYLALVDSVLLFTTLHIGTSLIIPKRIHAQFQGCVTCGYSFILLLSAITMSFVALGLVLLMISLLLAMPFGTIVYLARWGFFERVGASSILTISIILLIAYLVLMLLAQQRFLENRGWLFIIFSSLILKIITIFLHGLVPIILVSITDGIAAIIAGVCGIIWAIILLIGAIPAILKAIRFDR